MPCSFSVDGELEAVHFGVLGLTCMGYHSLVLCPEPRRKLICIMEEITFLPGKILQAFLIM